MPIRVIELNTNVLYPYHNDNVLKSNNNYYYINHVRVTGTPPREPLAPRKVVDAALAIVGDRSVSVPAAVRRRHSPSHRRISQKCRSSVKLVRRRRHRARANYTRARSHSVPPTHRLRAHSRHFFRSSPSAHMRSRAQRVRIVRPSNKTSAIVVFPPEPVPWPIRVYVRCPRR